MFNLTNKSKVQDQEVMQLLLVDTSYKVLGVAPPIEEKRQQVEVSESERDRLCRLLHAFYMEQQSGQTLYSKELRLLHMKEAEVELQKQHDPVLQTLLSLLKGVNPFRGKVNMEVIVRWREKYLQEKEKKEQKRLSKQQAK